MKKLQFVSAVAVAVAMIGCSSDDLNLVNENYELAKDGSEVFVTVGSQQNFTRAGFANEYNTAAGTIRQTFLWAENDVFKMYCTDTWKPQLYKFTEMATVSGVNGAVFTWADDGSKYNKGEDATDMDGREYAVFPAGSKEGEPELKFTDEFRTALTMTIESTVDYGTPEILEDVTYSQAGTNMSNIDGRMYVSNTLVPMFGFAVNNKIAFNHMTALLRVNVRDIETGEHTLTLASQANKLSGTFVTKDFDAANYTTTDLPNFANTAEEGETLTEAEKSLTVKFTANKETLGTDYFIYIPVPVGTYEAGDLTLTLDKDNTSGFEVRNITISDLTVIQGSSATTTSIDLTKEEVTVAAGNYLLATTSKPVVEYVNNLEDLQAIFDGFKDMKREAVYHIWGGSSTEAEYFDIAVPELYLGDNEEKTTLTVPELQAPVTVYLHGAFSAEESQKNKTLKIVGAGKGNKLTLNLCNNEDGVCTGVTVKEQSELVASTAEINISKIPTIELNGSFDGDVEIAATDLTIGGKFGGEMNLTATTLTLNNIGEQSKSVNISTEATTVNIAKEVYGAITAEKATAVTIMENARLNGSVTAENAAVTVKSGLSAGTATTQAITAKSAEISANVYGIVTVTGKAKVSGSSYVPTINAGEVEIETDGTETGTFEAITANGNVTITKAKNAIGRVTITDGKLALAAGNTITTATLSKGEDSEKEISADIKGTVTTLTISGGDVTVNAGATVGTLTLTDGDLTIKKGETASGAVTTLNLTNGDVTMEGGSINTLAYTSTEDAEEANSVTTTGDAAITTVTVDGEAYAADDKNVLTFTSTWTGETVEMTLSSGNTTENSIFTAAQLSNVTGVKTFALHTDITIDTNATWKALTGFKGNFYGNGHAIKGLTKSFFSTWNCTGERARAIKDIKFENATATNAVLVNTVTSESANTISGIEIANATVTGTDYAAALVGTVSGTVTFEGNKITKATVSAKSNIGAMAGKASGTITFTDNTITKSGVTFTVTGAADLKRVLEDGPAGTVGYYVGTIEQNGSVAITSTATDLTFTAEQKKAFGFEKNVTYNLQNLTYHAFEGCGWVGFSKGATEETLKVNNAPVGTNVYSETALSNN